MPIDKNQVKKVAKLSRISLDDNKIRNIMGVFNDYSTKTEVG